MQRLVGRGNPGTYALAGEEKFSITHDVLARDMGTAREVVTRLLKQFQTEGYVRLSRGYIEVLDAKALKKYEKCDFVTEETQKSGILRTYES